MCNSAINYPNRPNDKWVKFQKYSSFSCYTAGRCLQIKKPYFLYSKLYVSKANESEETCIPTNETQN